jgi:hypothetical protein
VSEPESSRKGLLIIAVLAAVLLVAVFLMFGDTWVRWFPSR